MKEPKQLSRKEHRKFMRDNNKLQRAKKITRVYGAKVSYANANWYWHMNESNFYGALILHAFPEIDNTRKRAKTELMCNNRASNFMVQITPMYRPAFHISERFRFLYP